MICVAFARISCKLLLGAWRREIDNLLSMRKGLATVVPCYRTCPRKIGKKLGVET